MALSRTLLTAAVALAALHVTVALAQVPRQPTAEPPRTGTTEIPAAPDETSHQKPPEMSPEAKPVQFNRNVFGPDPDYADKPYDPKAQLEIYGGKHRVNGPRPPVEIGRDLYSEGPLGNGYNLIGSKNRLFPQLMVFGDWRSAVAYNDNGALETGQVATRLNVDVDLKLTATERIHMFVTPLQQGGKFTRKEFFGDDHNDSEFIKNGNIRTLFFEGDAGQILSGLTDEYQTFDLPFTFGFVPLLFQNGIWMEDAIIGGAFTIPSRNSAALDITNMDVTFFGGGDRVTSQAVKDANGKVADHAANVFGVATFIETLSGYIEAGYGYTQDTRDGADFSYHNATLAFTRRYGGWLSNSVRGIVNFGQDPGGNRRQTADGFILLMENSLITSRPLTLLPYANFWVGFDKPQSLARDAGAGGVLRNTGINFETDGLTNFPKLDDTGNDTFGGAVGLEYLFDLHQQIVVEAATVQVIGGDFVPGRPAASDQYALGVRYQLPLNDRWILRADAIRGWKTQQGDVAGVRLEVRRKF